MFLKSASEQSSLVMCRILLYEMASHHRYKYLALFVYATDIRASGAKTNHSFCQILLRSKGWGMGSLLQIVSHFSSQSVYSSTELYDQAELYSRAIYTG